MVNMGFSGAAATTLQRPVLYNPQHLRRWRAAYAQADQTIIPVVVVGDSIFYGIGADNTLSTTSAVAYSKGVCGRLQTYFNLSNRTLQQAPGSGFLGAGDSQVTPGGAPSKANWEITALANGYRLIAAAQTLTLTVPTGVTSIGVIQGNGSAGFNTGHSGLADVTGLVNVNGGGFVNLNALTGTNQPLVTNVACAAGNSFVVEGPATAQTFISGFIMNNGVTNGVQVHRVCLTGLVSGFLQGGQLNGVLTQSGGGGSFANQAAQANYKFTTNTGVVVVEFGFNDQQFQNGGGSGSQNFVQVGQYQTWIQNFCNQAVSDGWCVLLVACPRNAGQQPGSPQLNQYFGLLNSIAANTDHVAYVDIGDYWGPFTASQADGLQISGDEHPSQAGHGDIAAMIYQILNNYAFTGITETSKA